MLDDVVMSIDSQHRRNIARLLKEKISDRYQIILTTHDRIWDRHLRSEGVISSNNSIEFSTWTIDEGPFILSEKGDWGRIESLLEDGDVKGAAHRLRHTAEWFLREACYQMEAETIFKDRWSFGDFINSAMNRYKNLLKKAKNACNSWGESTKKLDKVDETRKKVFEEINNKVGEINPNVHYNADEWLSYTPEELKAVYIAFKNLYGLFWCDNCSSWIRVFKDGSKEVSVKCRCGKKADWNLESKK
jgi:hypothetical protein